MVSASHIREALAECMGSQTTLCIPPEALGHEGTAEVMSCHARPESISPPM